MPIDPNIALQAQAPQFASPLDAAVKGMTLKQMMLQNQTQQRAYDDDQALRSALSKNITLGPDGTPTVNRAGVMAQLGPAAPMLAIKQNQDWAAQDKAAADAKFDILDKHAKAAHTVASSILTGPQFTNEQKQASWDNALAQADKMGLPNNSNLPKAYPGDSFVVALQNQTQDYSKQHDQMAADRGLDLKEKEVNAKIDENHLHREDQRTDKLNKRFDDFAKDMDPDRGRAGNFGQASAKVMQAQHLTALSDKLKSGQDLTPTEMEEYALGTANLISGGSGTSRGQVEALVPHSGVLDTNKVLSYLTNNPRGAGQQAFVNQMHGSIVRQQAVSQDQLDQIRAGRLPNYSDLQAKDPDKFKRILESKGFDSSRLDAKGRYTPKYDEQTAAPKEGDTYKDPNSGATYKVVGDHWVQQ